MLRSKCDVCVKDYEFPLTRGTFALDLPRGYVILAVVKKGSAHAILRVEQPLFSSELVEFMIVELEEEFERIDGNSYLGDFNTADGTTLLVYGARQGQRSRGGAG